MELYPHNICNLFAQLGLPSDTPSVELFIATHAPLPEALHLHKAPFWSISQATFLQEEILEDADWAPAVDALNLRLHH